VLAIILAACATTPTYLTDLEQKDYTDTQMVMDQLDCTSNVTEFDIGVGVTSEQEAIQVVRGVADQQVAPAIQRAERIGDHVWVLATESGQVIGALHPEGGVALCVQDVVDDQE